MKHLRTCIFAPIMPVVNHYVTAQTGGQYGLQQNTVSWANKGVSHYSNLS